MGSVLIGLIVAEVRMNNLAGQVGEAAADVEDLGTMVDINKKLIETITEELRRAIKENCYFETTGQRTEQGS